MPRACFQLQVRPDRIEEYKARHAAVWSDMVRALHETGWHNYSLFLRDDGLLIGYYETDDDAAAQTYLAASPVAARWEAEMGRFFVGLEGRPDQAATPLTEIFHLEDQLAAASITEESDAS